MKRVILLLCIMLAGCASASHTYGPDGRDAYSLNCSGAARTWGMCLEKAGDLCGTRGYEVLQASSEEGFIAAANAGASISGNRANFAGSGSSAFFAGTTHSRSMLIACKKPS